MQWIKSENATFVNKIYCYEYSGGKTRIIKTDN